MSYYQPVLSYSKAVEPVEPVEPVELKKIDVPTEYLKNLANILAYSNKSISHGRILLPLMTDLKSSGYVELPHPKKYKHRADLAPTSLVREILLMLQSVADEYDVVDMAMDVLDGSVNDMISEHFVYAFYKLNYPSLVNLYRHWDELASVVGTMTEINLNSVK